MARDGSGNYSLPSGNPVVTATTISSTWANTTFTDIGAELQDSLSRSGKGGMSAALRGVDGSVSAPALSFNNETNSGWYRAGSGDFRFSVAGADKGKFTASGFEASFISGSHTLPDGVLSTNVPLLNAANTFTALNKFGDGSTMAEVMRLVAKDTVGDCFIGYYQNNGTTRKGYLGYAAAAGDDVYWTNEVSGGHVRISTNAGSMFYSGDSGTTAHLQIGSTGVANFLSSSSASLGFASSTTSTYATFFVSTSTPKGYIGAGSSLGGSADANSISLRSEGNLQFLTSGSNTRFIIDSSGNYNFAGGTVTTTGNSSSEVGFKGMPILDKRGSNWTLTAADNGKLIIFNTGAILTVPGGLPIGFTCCCMQVQSSGGMTIARGASQALYWSGTDFTNNDRSLSRAGIATLIYVDTNFWLISGTDIS